jgi:hypothetical protein
MTTPTLRRALTALVAALALSALTATSALASGPPIVETKPATSVKGTSANLTGVVNPNGASTKYYFEYGTTTAYGLKTAEATTIATKEVSKTVKELSAGTIYHFRIVASNSFGTTNGLDETFTTVAENPKPAFAVKAGEKLTELEYNGSFGTTDWAQGASSFECTSGSIQGSATGPKTLTAKVVFHECKSGMLTCQSGTAPVGEVITEELQGTLVYLSKAAKTAAVVFKAKTGENWTTLRNCMFLFNDVVRGSLVVPVEPVNVMKFNLATKQLSEKEGKQEITEYENAFGEKASGHLETSPGGELGWDIPALTLTTNKQVEISA